MDNFTSSSPEETISIGRRLGETLVDGSVLFLNGPLGAGKTTFVKGIALGMGLQSEDHVTSPTFPVLHIYKCAKRTLFHFDLFRIQPEEFFKAGWDEHIEDGVLCIEWGEKIGGFLHHKPLRVTFQQVSAHERSISWDGNALN